ncbi:MAG: ribosome biogenesis GTP-binding protein YihA/YsxC [Eubacterium sp.]|nr:ribosome biogenesis GTP-binding protein YihA/YsxC [Eubacterium sp.]
MRVNNAEIDKTAVKKTQYPVNGLPEVAFAGKSNVGKSSLINTMAQRKALARTSGSPGKTRTINFFIIEKSLYFVDLPGYGYAKASKAETAKWGTMMDEYLLDRELL